MKLLNCRECHDILLILDTMRECRCKKSSARYINDIKVLYKGPCRILGIAKLGLRQVSQGKTTLDDLGLSSPRYEWFEILEGQNIKKSRDSLEGAKLVSLSDVFAAALGCKGFGGRRASISL